MYQLNLIFQWFEHLTDHVGFLVVFSTLAGCSWLFLCFNGVLESVFSVSTIIVLHHFAKKVFRFVYHLLLVFVIAVFVAVEFFGKFSLGLLWFFWRRNFFDDWDSLRGSNLVLRWFEYINWVMFSRFSFTYWFGFIYCTFSFLYILSHGCLTFLNRLSIFLFFRNGWILLSLIVI